MTAQEARQMVQEGKAILIDVREEQELRETGTAEGAIWMPSSAIEDEPRWNAFKDSLPKDKLLILFCKLGGRAGRMTEFLCIDGFRLHFGLGRGCICDTGWHLSDILDPLGIDPWERSL